MKTQRPLSAPRWTFSLALSTLLSVTVVSACGGDKTVGDPEVVSKGDLNPPMNLTSVTDDASMNLEWIITNTEEDLVGYNVYVAEGTLASLQGTLGGKLAALDLASQQVRRCKDTKALFKIFGFSDTADQADKDCDDFGTEDDTPAAGSPSSGAAGNNPADGPAGGALADPSKGAAPAATFVKCTDGKSDIGTAGALSVAIKSGLTSAGVKFDAREARAGALLRCIIPKDSKLSDGKTGFTNGKSYVAFVVAVRGEEANSISYTSNFVEDMPTPYTQLSVDAMGANKFQPFTIDTVKGTAAKGTPGDCPANSSDVPAPSESCRLGKGLALTSGTGNAPVFAFASDMQEETERVFVIGQKGRVYILPARPRNEYDAQGSFAARPGIKEPGDVVLSYDDTQYKDNEAFEVNPGSLYYVAVASGTNTFNYGKLYVESVSTSTGETAAPGEGNKTVKAWFALQPTVGAIFAELPYLARLGSLLR